MKNKGGYLFDFLKKKKTPIDFSEQNVSELTLKSDLLGQTLIENGMGFYVDYLSQIRLAADNKNDAEFRKLILKSGLFKGQGSLGDIRMKSPSENRKFNSQLYKYINLISQMGIRKKYLT